MFTSYIGINRKNYQNNKIQSKQNILSCTATNSIEQNSIDTTTISTTTNTNKNILPTQLSIRLKDYLILWKNQQEKENIQNRNAISTEDVNILAMFQPGMNELQYIYS